MATNVHRILETSAEKVYDCCTQHNLIDGEAKLPCEHRNEILKEIEECAKKNDDVNDVMIAGDLNENIASKQIQQFFNKIGVMDIHQWCNKKNGRA